MVSKNDLQDDLENSYHHKFARVILQRVIFLYLLHSAFLFERIKAGN